MEMFPSSLCVKGNKKCNVSRVEKNITVARVEHKREQNVLQHSINESIMRIHVLKRATHIIEGMS